MKTYTLSNQNFNGKFIYDKSLSAKQIGTILKVVDKKAIAKKDYNIRFKQSSRFQNLLVLCAENDAQSKISKSYIVYNKSVKKEEISEKIVEVMEKYEHDFAFFNYMIRKFRNLFKKEK